MARTSFTFNGKWRGDDPIGSLMRDFNESDPDRIRDKMLYDRVHYLKRDPEGVNEMCEIMDELYQQGIELDREEGRAEGRAAGQAEGRELGILEAARRLMSTMGWDAEEAMARLGMSDDEREALLPAMLAQG